MQQEKGGGRTDNVYEFLVANDVDGAAGAMLLRTK